MARANPRPLNGGWFNASSRICLALLKEKVGVEIEEVSYRQIGATLTDMMSGRLDLGFIDTLGGETHILSGRLRLLAVTMSERVASQPAVPTLADFEVMGFLGFAVLGARPSRWWPPSTRRRARRCGSPRSPAAWRRWASRGATSPRLRRRPT